MDTGPSWSRSSGNMLPEFRTSSSSAPAKVKILHIDLKIGAQPVCVKLRNYYAEKSELMAILVSELMLHKPVYSNPTSPWSSAPRIVPKPGPSRWRFTVAIRTVNRFTTRHQYSMPILELEWTKLAGSRFYPKFDFVHSYCHLPLHTESRECRSFITPDGI